MKILYEQIHVCLVKTYKRYIYIFLKCINWYNWWFNKILFKKNLFTCDSFIYRAVRSPLIKLLCCHYDKSRCFSIFLLRCSNVYCIHILFVVKLAFNFIRSWFVTLYFSGSHFSVTYQFYDFIHDLFLFFDINT